MPSRSSAFCAQKTIAPLEIDIHQKQYTLLMMRVFFFALAAGLALSPATALAQDSSLDARLTKIDLLLKEIRTNIETAEEFILSTAPKLKTIEGQNAAGNLRAQAKALLQAQCVAEISLEDLVARKEEFTPDTLMRSIREYYPCEALIQRDQGLCKTLDRYSGPLKQDARAVDGCLDHYNSYTISQLNITERADADEVCESLNHSFEALDGHGAGASTQEACAEMLTHPRAYCNFDMTNVSATPPDTYYGCIKQSIYHGVGSICAFIEETPFEQHIFTGSKKWCLATAAYRKAYQGQNIQLCGDSLGCRMFMGENVCGGFLHPVLQNHCEAQTQSQLKATLAALTKKQKEDKKRSSQIKKEMRQHRAQIKKGFAKLRKELKSIQDKERPPYARRLKNALVLEKGFEEFTAAAEQGLSPRATLLSRALLKKMARVQAAAKTAPIEWVPIPGGRFMMGTGELGQPPQERIWRIRDDGESFRRDVGDSPEYPRHAVTVKDFQMAKTEVTKGQYKACMDTGLCSAPTCKWPPAPEDENTPVVCVNWKQAKTFSEWVGGRLPSEAEWEYAARSGGKDWAYPWGDEVATCGRAVIAGCTGKEEPVCSRPAGNTVQGLCDMAGNAWEWTQDWYHTSYMGAPRDGSAREDKPDTSRWEDPSGATHVFRGGCWSFDARRARAANRDDDVPGGRYGDIGFRPVR